MRDRAEREERFLTKSRTLILIFGLVSNIILYLWLRDRRNRGREVQMQSYDQLKGKIFIDKEKAIEMGLSKDDLQRMASQPDKYVLSRHLQRRLDHELKGH